MLYNTVRIVFAHNSIEAKAQHALGTEKWRLEVAASDYSLHHFCARFSSLYGDDIFPLGVTELWLKLR